MNRTDYLAFKQAHPRKPIKLWRVRSGGITMYENTSVALCWHFINTHGLKLTPKACY